MKSHSSKTSYFRWSLLAFAYAAIFLTILALAYTGNLPKFFQRIPYYDTIGHVVLYCIATYLGHRVLGGRAIAWLGCRLPLWPSLFALFTLAEELTQIASPNRTFSWSDAIASLLGIALGYWLAEQSLPKRE